MKKIRLFAAAIIALGITSCNTRESVDDHGGIDNAPQGYLALRIGNAATRAVDPGSASEKTIQSIHVYLFNTDGTGTPTVVHLDNTKFTTDPDGKITLNDPIRTSIKAKYAFIGTNLTTGMQTEIGAQRGNLITEAFTQLITDLADADGSSFVMFTEEMDVASSNIKPTAAEANTSPVSATLIRLPSKVAVYYNNTTFNGDGTFAEDEVEFAWRRINKMIFYVQKEDFIDPNYNAGELTQANRDDSQLYVSVNPSDNITRFRYTTENTFNFDATTIRTNDATAISIRVYFQPTAYAEKTGPDWTSVDNTTTPGPQGDDFWAVNTDNGSTYYFNSAYMAYQFWSEATAGTITISGVVIRPVDSTYKERHYINGACYYNVYPHSNGDLGDQYRYNILRNQYFKMALNSLTAPGEPNWDFDKDQPITEYGYIQFNITVQDWELFEESIDM